MRRTIAFAASSAVLAVAACSDVQPPEPSSSLIAVRVEPENPVIPVDDTELVMKALAILESGEARDVSESPATTWASSDEDVLSVNADGTLQIDTAGVAFVTASVSGITSPPQKVTVIAAPTSPPPTPIPTAAPTADHVVISEVLYDAASSLGTEAQFEYVELFNPTVSTVDLTGWAVVGNGGTATASPLPALSIPAGAYVLIADDTSSGTFDTAYGVTPDARVNLGFLTNTGEWLVLRDGTMAVIDEVAWDEGENGTKPTDWCTADLPEATKSPGPVTAGEARSIARNPDGSDGDSCDDWQSDAMPSPRAANP